MNDMISHLLTLKAETRGYWAERIVAELEYAVNLSRSQGRKHDALLRATIESLAAQSSLMGALTRETVEETEAKLQSIAAEAKTHTILCVAHAHIDMNWMWRFDETVAVTLDTFRTMLTLMTEYPGFTFSQSQAAVYRIVEEHDPDMLKEIRKRIKEGRWEVTASTWVEADKNLPSGESLVRQTVHARRYLSALLDLPPESFMLDFEPDTFGHSRNLPEILTRAGVRWYYHCRGGDEHDLYRWQAPSGASLIAYRDPFWYNAEVSPSMTQALPEFCRKHGMDTMPRMYGVGNHGGGPTRRDIERIVEMDAWPLFPRLRFGTLREFFTAAEKNAARLPVANRELNFIFTGCYTTQSRIKAANRMAESRLIEAETMASLVSLLTVTPFPARQLQQAWEIALFNHFHDIIPGSGTVDTREYAMGENQRLLAIAGTVESLALKKIASQIDTSSLGNQREDARATTSEGGGAGFGVSDFGLSSVERGRGRNRIFYVFNPLPWKRSGVAEVVVWDWQGDPARALVTDETGAQSAHQVVPNALHPYFGPDYWGHRYMRVLIPVEVPGCGYRTYSLSESTPQELPVERVGYPRVERQESFTLENGLIRAVFDPKSAALLSLVDKESGEEMVDPSRGAGIFRLVREDDSRGMSAWVVGRWMSVRSLHDSVRVTPAAGGDSLSQWLIYEVRFGQSRLKATVSLERDSSSLSWSVECEWLEVGRPGDGVPQLNFFLPLAGDCKSYRFDVPFGAVDRPPADMDVPANSWALGVPKKAGHKAVMMSADQTHGFRCVDNSLSLTLLRSSFDPDPHPELGAHRFSFAVSLVEPGSTAALVRRAGERAHPFLVVSGTDHAGTLQLSGGFLSLEEGTVAISAVKIAEEVPTGRVVVRVNETDGKKTTAVIRFFCTPSRVWRSDLNELTREEAGTAIQGDRVTVEMEPHSVATLVIQFQGCRE
jgi:alpha-mannosidase